MPVRTVKRKVSAKPKAKVVKKTTKAKKKSTNPIKASKQLVNKFKLCVFLGIFNGYRGLTRILAPVSISPKIAIDAIIEAMERGISDILNELFCNWVNDEDEYDEVYELMSEDSNGYDIPFKFSIPNRIRYNPGEWPKFDFFKNYLKWITDRGYKRFESLHCRNLFDHANIKCHTATHHGFKVTTISIDFYELEGFHDRRMDFSLIAAPIVSEFMGKAMPTAIIGFPNLSSKPYKLPDYAIPLCSDMTDETDD